MPADKRLPVAFRASLPNTKHRKNASRRRNFRNNVRDMSFAGHIRVSHSFVKNQRFNLMSGAGIQTETGVLFPGVTRGRGNMIWHLSETELAQTDVGLLLLKSPALKDFFKVDRKSDRFGEKTGSIILRKDKYRAAIEVDEFRETTEFFSLRGRRRNQSAD